MLKFTQCWTVLMALLIGASTAVAQPAGGGTLDDVRSINPRVLLAFDTSGSMQRKPGCICSRGPAADPSCGVCPRSASGHPLDPHNNNGTPLDVTDDTGCNDCLPNCSGQLPPVAPLGFGPAERSRLQTLVEVLTGEPSNPTDTSARTCRMVQRNSTGGFTTDEVDYDYPIPHYEWNITSTVNPGILDKFEKDVDFGLMTFDGTPGWTAGEQLIESTAWTAANAVSPAGGLSYGEDKDFTFLGCNGTTYTINVGAKGYALDNWPGTDGTQYPNSWSSGTTYLGAMAPFSSDPAHAFTWTQNTGGRFSFDASSNPNPTDDIARILKQVRPYGSTPIAGMLDDIRYSYATMGEPGYRGIGVSGREDLYGRCRKNFVVLLTDGYPNLEFRGAPFHCEADGFDCPYDRAEDIVADLVKDAGEALDNEMVDGVFVIGFNVEGGVDVRGNVDGLGNPIGNGTPDVEDFLNDLARIGKTNTPFFANNAQELSQVFSNILGQTLRDVTSRTLPAFSGGGGAGGSSQAQFNSGFRAGQTAIEPWFGVLERLEYKCKDAGAELDPARETEGDMFHLLLDAQRDAGERKLYTAAPTAAAPNGWLVAEDLPGLDDSIVPDMADFLPPTAGADWGSEEIALLPWDTSNVTKEVLDPGGGVGITDTAAEAIVNWVAATTVVGGKPFRHAMGDIFHSTPTVVRTRLQSGADAGYEVFLQGLRAAQRPSVLYFSTNDGILHAMLSENWCPVVANGEVAPNLGADGICNVGDPSFIAAAGHELWGYIPPAVYPRLPSLVGFNESTSDYFYGRQETLDAMVITKDVSLAWLPGEADSAQRYRTVLLAGQRGGGRTYTAMDVTDPTGVGADDAIDTAAPTLLWQFTDDDMGQTYPEAGLTEALIVTDATGDEVQRRAIAIMPGGAGKLSPGLENTECDSTPAASPAAKDPPNAIYSMTVADTRSVRTARHCWQKEGRGLYIVDVSTGLLLRKWDSDSCDAGADPDDTTCLMSPMLGGVSLFPNGVGQAATAGYMMDADGILWRLDLSSSDPAEWTLLPMYDMFNEPIANSTLSPGLAGRPTFGPPLLSVNDNGDVVIILATGDLDSLENPDEVNRIVSLTERVDTTGTEPFRVAEVNWETTLLPGEQVTGPIQLFEGNVYYATFKTETDATDGCHFGYARLCGVNYIERRPGQTGPTQLAPLGAFTAADGTLFDCEGGAAGPYENQVINGVQIAQRPSCVDTATISCTDLNTCPESGELQQASNTSVGEVTLVALVGGEGQEISGSGSSIESQEKTLEAADRTVTALSWLASPY